MARNHQRNSGGQPAAQAPATVRTEFVEDPAVTTKDVNIEVQHAWRRSATKAAMEKLWSAMELSREDGGQPGDESLEQQQAAWKNFYALILGDDAT